MPIYEIWKAKGPQIMAQMEASHRMMQAQGAVPPPKPSQQSNAASTGSNAGTADAALNTPSTQPGSDIQALKTRKQVNDAITALGEGKWEYVAGKRVKSPKFKALLERRKAVTAAANKKKAAFKQNLEKQRAESPSTNFSSIFK